MGSLMGGSGGTAQGSGSQTAGSDYLRSGGDTGQGSYTSGGSGGGGGFDWNAFNQSLNQNRGQQQGGGSTQNFSPYQPPQAAQMPGGGGFNQGGLGSLTPIMQLLAFLSMPSLMTGGGISGAMGGGAGGGMVGRAPVAGNTPGLLSMSTALGGGPPSGPLGGQSYG